MKIIPVLISIFFSFAHAHAHAQKHEFVGSLINFDDEIIAKCIVKTSSDTFIAKSINLFNISYLDNSIDNINLRLFTDNGIGGNLYLGSARDTKFIINTDSVFKLLEVSILDSSDSYKCTNFYEK